jgi:hypothetical protein
LHDPLVGGHVLIGAAFSMVYLLGDLVVQWGSPVPDVYVAGLQGVRAAVGVLVGAIPTGLLRVMFLFFLFFLLRVILRRQWLAIAVFLLLISLLALTDPVPLVTFVAGLMAFGSLILLIVRWGLLALAVSWLLPVFMPFTINLSAWYSGYGIIPAGTTLAVSIWAFRTALAGRPLFRDGFLESD